MNEKRKQLKEKEFLHSILACLFMMHHKLCGAFLFVKNASLLHFTLRIKGAFIFWL